MKSTEKLLFSFFVLSVLCFMMTPSIDAAAAPVTQFSSNETNGLVPGIDAVSAPLAFFTSTDTIGKAPFTVQFLDISLNIPTGWKWDFGDGNLTNANVQNPTHTYTQPGVYDVTLNVTNSAGFNLTTKVGYITVSNATASKIGVYVNGAWYLDDNGNGVFESGIDKAYGFGGAGYTPVVGDWNGDNRTKIGVFQQYANVEKVLQKRTLCIAVEHEVHRHRHDNWDWVAVEERR